MEVFGKNIKCRNCNEKLKSIIISKNYNFNFFTDKKKQMPAITGVPCPSCGKYNLKRIKKDK